MRPTLRRQPWGALWATAPWDGTRRRPPAAPVSPAGLTVVGIPEPAPVPADAPARRRLLRTPFGSLLRSVPWGGPRDVSDPLLDTTLILTGAGR